MLEAALCGYRPRWIRRCSRRQRDRPGARRRSDGSSRGQGGEIDILVNNAGIAGPTVPFDARPSNSGEETIAALTLTGPFLTCRAALPYLKASGKWRIVNIGSATGKRPLAGLEPGCRKGIKARSRRDGDPGLIELGAVGASP